MTVHLPYMYSKAPCQQIVLISIKSDYKQPEHLELSSCLFLFMTLSCSMLFVGVILSKRGGAKKIMHAIVNLPSGNPGSAPVLCR